MVSDAGNRLEDYAFQLPPELVAQQPAERRDGARLMVIPGRGPFQHRAFTDLPEYLSDGDVLVLNDTRVMPARLTLHRETGGRVDALLVRALDDRTWEALLDTPRKLREGETLELKGRAHARINRSPDRWVLTFNEPVAPLMAQCGHAPLPPYVRRDAGVTDLERYQTVYAEREGAIAAPTAGLHFTEAMLATLARKVEVVRVTLHVGIGTFKPVKVDLLDEHRMDMEWYEVRPDAEAAIRRAMGEGRRVVAVGTTSCRTLESWASTGQASGWTSLFIRPPHEFKVVSALLTNFHMPKSTLLMLVSAFSGRERILEAYAEAVRQRYRFYSYGDATFLTRP